MAKLTRRKKILVLARASLYRDETCEIDENAPISKGDDNGCYVQAWVWFDFTGTQFDKNKQKRG